jgi:hypothetical protein
MTDKQIDRLTILSVLLAAAFASLLGCAGSEAAPLDGSPDAEMLAPDTSPAKVDTRPADTSPAKVDTRPADTRPADTMPSDTRPADTFRPTPDTLPPDTFPIGCLVCAGNGLWYPSTDPYSDGLPCAAKAITYQCEDCPNGGTTRLGCCMVNPGCEALKKK